MLNDNVIIKNFDMKATDKTAIFISIIVLFWMIFTAFFAPCLLVVGVVWLITFIFNLFKKQRIDYLSLIVSCLCFGLVLFVFFVPLWIAESKAKTSDDFFTLAERYNTRGQILGNRVKTQLYYLKAAEGGNIEAQARLGEALYFGHYGTTKHDEGLRWLKLAASNGHKNSQNLIQSIEKN
jgi:energy-coupling factor transporter transmembrane protein EcfT